MGDTILIGLSEILVMGLAAQWIAWRFKFPSILLLLLFGFLIGPVSNLLDPDALFGRSLFPVVSLSVAIVLFEGGLSLRLSELGDNATTVGKLVTVGILITWALGAAAAYLLTDLGLSLSLLVGAIFVVSGPTVIVPLLRYVRPVGQIGTIVKWEGIINDPLGAALAVLVFEAILAGSDAPLVVILGTLQTLFIGGGFGLLAAWMLILPLRRFWIPDFLQNTVVLMMVCLAFTVSNLLQQDSGLLTVTVMGVYLSNQHDLVIRHIVEFKENLRTLIISALFIVLAARLDIDTVLQIGWGSVLFVLILILVVRPVAVFLSTFRSGLNWREKIFLSWMAPRGIVAAAVSSVFALELADHGVAGAEKIVPITFLVILATVSIYGLTAAPLGRWLKVAHPDPQGVLIAGAHDWAISLGQVLSSFGIRVVLIDTNPNNINEAQKAGLEGFQANVVSDQIIDELDFGGIGRFLALTPNNEVNSLASLHFIELFSRVEVYQLAMRGDRDAGENNEEVASMLRGRCLFGAEHTFNNLDQIFREGGTLQTFEITSAFTFNTFREQYGAQAIPLFVVTETGELVFVTTDASLTPRTGQKLISLVRSA